VGLGLGSEKRRQNRGSTAVERGVSTLETIKKEKERVFNIFN